MSKTGWGAWRLRGTKSANKTEHDNPEERPSQREGGATREETRHALAQAGVDEGPIEIVPDVLLDVPTVKVDEITLDVENLRARVSLHAELANLVRLDVGADVGIERVKLTIKGVEAQALLKVRLQRVYEILDRALQTLDSNPELLASLLRPVGHAIGEVGEAAHESLKPGGAVSEAVQDVGGAAKGALEPGGTVNRVADQALGPGGPVRDAVKGTVGPEGVAKDASQALSGSMQAGGSKRSKHAPQGNGGGRRERRQPQPAPAPEQRSGAQRFRRGPPAGGSKRRASGRQRRRQKR
ncbi:hypothetical protein [Myxococcus xanthus]|uniref:hypothetical protein n=1 Tax=Myxococcus xanthus TaxID=34 RepID=UPI00112A0776|nr:hypothetical protein [Myxococcus xanthus]QDE98747.1 hypothetical protein BHS05_24545 [Myxococcus xanthus]